MNAAEMLALVWQARRAPTDDDALLPLSLLAAHLVKLTGEDSCAVFDAMRAPPPTPLKAPARPAVRRDAVEELTRHLRLVPVAREDGDAVEELTRHLRLVPVAREDGDAHH